MINVINLNIFTRNIMKYLNCLTELNLLDSTILKKKVYDDN